MNQRRLTRDRITASWVLMVCALAWYTRCAVIMLTSSAVRSTLESSTADDCNTPRLTELDEHTSGDPEVEDSVHMLLPICCRPLGVENFASTTLPSTADWPLL